MKFSNKQFEVANRTYSFNPTTQIFSIFDGKQTSYPDTIFLIYKSHHPKDWENDFKKFEMRLVKNGKSVKDEDGAICKKDPNEEYYTAVEAMRKEAIRLSS